MINAELGFHSVNRPMEFSTIESGQIDSPVCALQQCAGYANAVARMGARTHMLTALSAAQPVAQIRIVERRFGPLRFFWVPRGPVWHKTASPAERARVLADLPTALDRKGIWLIAPEEEADTTLFANRVLATAAHVAELDLTRTAQQRLADQHGKWRNRLRHAQKSGLTVGHRRFELPRDSKVLALEEAQRHQRGYRALPAAFMRAWCKANPGEARLFTASKGHTELAFMLVLLHAPVATYHIGWSGIEGRRLSAHTLALWEASAWLAKKGYQRFDLGTLDTESAPGLARFKIGSGARVRALGPTCLWLPRLIRIRRAQNAAA